MTIGRNPVVRTTVLARRHRTQAATFKAQVPVDALRGQQTVVKRSSEIFGANARATPAPGTEKIEAKTSGYHWEIIF